MRPVIRTAFGRRGVPRDVDAELAFHLDMRARQLVQSGMSPEQALDEARRQFGDLPRIRDACVTYDQERIRAMERASLLQDLRQDVIWSIRVMRRTPLVSLVVILTLALGIGANTAIFDLVNAILLQRLPVRAPDELVVLGDPTRTGGMSYTTDPRGDMYSFRTWQRLQAHEGTLAGLAASGRADRIHVIVSGETGAGDTPRARMVSGNFFQVLGVPAALGRTFIPGDDDAVGGAPVVTLSHGYWQRRFGGDSGVIGREVLINEARFTVVGVTPASFTGEVVGQTTDLWLPVSMQGVLWPNRAVLDDAQAFWLLLIGRMRPGVTMAQVTSDMNTATRAILGDQFGPAQADAVASVDLPVASAARGLSRVRDTYRGPLLILMAGVAVLLLIICANVANILMARAVARAREMGVRLAIGAGRGRLVRQLLTECLLLAILGAAGGLLLADWGSRFLLVLAADGGSSIRIDTGLSVVTVGFTVVLSMAAVLVFGLLPALRASRVDVATTIRASARSLTGMGGMGQRNPLGRLLISAQVALSVVLLVGATLLVRSLRHVQITATGVDRDHLLIVSVDANARGYAEARLSSLAASLSRRVGQIPGVAAVSFSMNGIFSGTESALNIDVPGFEYRDSQDSTSYYDDVGPGFAATTGARLLRGRDFTESDRAGSPPVVILNETFARYYFGDQSPVGRTMRLGDSTFAEVVGVIADIRDRSLTAEPVKRYYTPFLQRNFGDQGILRLVIRTTGDPGALLPRVREMVRAEDPDLAIDSADRLSDLMRQSVREERLLARLATLFGGVALLLAAIGLYGVMSYAVTRRSGEIGLRVALGAQRGTVVRMVLNDALVLVGIGLAFGLPLTVGASRLLQNQLHGVGPTDPMAFTVALVVLASSAVLAALIPAWRASRVEPIVALQAE